MRRGPKPAKSKEAKPPVARKSPKNEDSKVRDLEKRLAEALEREAEALARETATGEILRVISSSPTDVQPVFDAIVQSAVDLCKGFFGIVTRYDGHVSSVVAKHKIPTEALELLQTVHNLPESLTSQALVSRAVVHVHDVTRALELSAAAKIVGYRTAISVPLLSDGQPIGTINVARRESLPFSDNEINLLKTFADQAVIAIENVRLFNETKEALDRQTATNEILRVISRSPTDIQPVFEAIAENSRRLCDSLYSAVYRADEDLVHLVAHNHSDAAAAEDMARAWPMPLTGASLTLEAMRTRSVVHIADVESAGQVSSSIRQRARLLGNRSFLSVPMLRDGNCIGAIRVSRSVPGGFSDRQVDLLKTFADQAVIAIENVRLFNETKEALDRQTATSEILRVISSSPTDAKPVCEAVGQR